MQPHTSRQDCSASQGSRLLPPWALLSLRFRPRIAPKLNVTGSTGPASGGRSWRLLLGALSFIYRGPLEASPGPGAGQESNSSRSSRLASTIAAVGVTGADGETSSQHGRRHNCRKRISENAFLSHCWKWNKREARSLNVMLPTETLLGQPTGDGCKFKIKLVRRGGRGR